VAEIVVQWAHFVAVGVWIGGLAALLSALAATPSKERRARVGRFSAVALWTVVVVAITGTLRAIGEIESWDELFSSAYGRVVLVKTGFVLALAALGALNRYRHVPAVARGVTGLRRIARVEVAVAGGALVAAAALATIAPPAAIPATARPTPAVVATGSDFATSVRVRLEADPGYAGPNRFMVSVRDYDTAAPVRARRVWLRFSFLDDAGVGETTLHLPQRSPGRYSASGVNLSLQGRWETTVVVDRDGGTLEIPLVVATRCEVQSAEARRRPTVHTMPLGAAGTVQSYVVSRRPGYNEVHVTYFDPDGREPRVERLVVEAARGDDPARRLDVRRFGPGHFVAGGRLEAGEWRFALRAERRTRLLSSCFEEEVGA
jgi:uncharacterized membrane protein